MLPSLTPQDMANIFAAGAVIVPLVTSLLKKQSWSTGVKQAITAGVSILVAVGVLLAGNQFGHVQFTWSYIVEAIALVYTASQFAYQALFNGSKVDRALTAFPHRQSYDSQVLGYVRENNGTYWPLDDALSSDLGDEAQLADKAEAEARAAAGIAP